MYDLNETDYLISKVIHHKKLYPPLYHEYYFKYPEFGLIKRVFIKYNNGIGMLYEDYMLTNKNTIIGTKYLYRSKEQLSFIRQKYRERMRKQRKYIYF
jgi:hypothetical protein